MRSPHTTGDDEPRPGISTFHFTFFDSLHSVGGSAWRDTPVACGPRHCGQNFSASVSTDHPESTESASSRRIVVLQAECGLRIGTL
jgi:hypothetical protein